MPNKHNTLTSLFDDIAQAIRDKQNEPTDAGTVTTPKIVADNFPDEISSIVTLEGGSADATAVQSDIRQGKTAYVAGSKVTGSMPTAEITSGAGTASLSAPSYNSSTQKFDITASGTVAAPSVERAGYISTTEGERDTNTISGSTSLNKIGISVETDGQGLRAPTLKRTAKPSGDTWTDAASGAAITTKPTNTKPYVQIDADANTDTLVATPKVTSAGYGTTTEGQYTATEWSETVGASKATTAYVPITEGSAGTPSASKGTVSNHSISVTPSVTNTTGWITGGTKTGTAVSVSASELVSGNKALSSGITNQTDIDVTNYETVSISAIASGSATTPTTTITSNPSVSWDSTNSTFKASHSKGQSITPTVSAGYVSTGTAGTVTASGSSDIGVVGTDVDITGTTTKSPTLKRTAKPNGDSWVDAASGAATTTKPTAAKPYIQIDADANTGTLTATPKVTTAGYGNSDHYGSTPRTATVGASAATTSYVPITEGTAGTPSASKSAVSNHSVTVTPSVTNTTGWITGSTKTGTGVSVSASELVSGNKALNSGTTAQTNIDVTNYATVSVAAIPTSAIDSSIITGSAFEEATDDYAWKTTVTIPAGYHTAQTIEKTFSSVFPAPESEATDDQVLLGYELFDHDGKKITGTMPNNSATGGTITTQGGTYTIPAGYTSGGTVTANINSGALSAADSSISGNSFTPTLTYNSTNDNFTYGGSANATGTAYAKASTDGYVTSSNNTSKALSATVSATGSVAKVILGASASGTAKVTPSISKQSVPSGVTDPTTTDEATTTAPSSGVYVAVKSGAAANTLTLNPSVSTAGYGTTSYYGQVAAANRQVSVGANDSSTTYVKIKEATTSKTNPTSSATNGTATITKQPSASASVTSSGIETSNSDTGYSVTASASSGSGTISATGGSASTTAGSVTVSAGYNKSDVTASVTASSASGTSASTTEVTKSDSKTLYIKAATSSSTQPTASATAGTASIVNQPSASASTSVTGMVTTNTNTGYSVHAESAANSGNSTATGGSASTTAGSLSVTTGYVGTAISKSVEAKSASGNTVTSTAVSDSASDTKYIQAGVLSASDSSISGSDFTPTISWSTNKFVFGGSSTVSGTAHAKVSTEGYVKAAANNTSKALSKTVSATGDVATVGTGVDITGATTKQPTINRTPKPSGDTSAWIDAGSTGTVVRGTTPPSSATPYVRVDSAANTGTLTATPKVSTEGYGSTAHYGSTAATPTVGASASAPTYIPIKEGTAGTPTASKGTVSSNQVTVTPSVTNVTGWITGDTKTGTGVVVKASELVSGNKALASGTSDQTGIDVTNYATVSISAIGAGTHSGTVSTHTVDNPAVTYKISGTVGNISSTTKPSGTDGTDYWTIDPDGDVTNGTSHAKAKATIGTAGYISTTSGESSDNTTSIGVTVTTGTNKYISKATSSKTNPTASATNGTASITKQPSASASVTSNGIETTTTNTGFSVTASASSGSGTISATGGSASTTAGSVTVGVGYNPTEVTASVTASSASGTSASTTEATASDSKTLYIKAATSSTTQPTASATAGTASILNDPSASASVTSSGIQTSNTDTGYSVTASASANSGNSTATGGSASTTAGSLSVTTGYVGTAISTSVTAKSASGNTATSTAKTASDSKTIYIKAAIPVVTGGTVSGSTSVSGNGNVTLSTTNNGIAVSSSGTAGRTKITYNGAVDGYVKATNGSDVSGGGAVTGQSLSGATKYITAITVPTQQGFSLTTETASSSDADAANTYPTVITNNQNRHTKIVNNAYGSAYIDNKANGSASIDNAANGTATINNAGTSYVTVSGTGSSHAGSITVDAYDGTTFDMDHKIVNNGEWVKQSPTAAGTFYGKTTITTSTPTITAGTSNKTLTPSTGTAFITSATIQPTPTETKTVNAQVVSGSTTSDTYTPTSGKYFSQFTVNRVASADPSFTGGTVSGSTSLSGSNVTLSDTNNGISVSSSGTANRTAVTYNGAVAGYVSKSNGATASAQPGTAATLSGSTKYITAVTVPSSTSFSVTNSGTTKVTSGGASAGTLQVQAYTGDTLDSSFQTVVNGGKWVTNTPSAAGTTYGKTIITTSTPTIAAGTSNKTLSPSSGSNFITSATIQPTPTETKTVNAQVVSGTTTSDTYTPTSGKYFSQFTVNRIGTADPAFDGGGISGSTSLSGSNVTLSSIDNGISVSASGSASRADVLYNGAVAGYVSKADNAVALSGASDVSITGATKYIKGITIPASTDNPHFSISQPDDSNSNTGYLDIENGTNRKVQVLSNSGSVSVLAASSSAGTLYASGYDGDTREPASSGSWTIVNRGQWVKTNVSAAGTYYGKVVVGSGSAIASATKGTVSNHSVTVTPSVTTTAGYIAAGGPTAGTAVTVSASELVSGNKTLSSSESDQSGIDVTDYATVSISALTGSDTMSSGSPGTRSGYTTWPLSYTSL